MADNTGMFGLSPSQLQQQQAIIQNNQANQFAQLSAAEQGQYGAFRGGQLVGNAVSGLLGVEDPQIAAAKEAQSLIGQFDTTSAEGLKSLSLALMDRAKATGNNALAGFAQQAAKQYQAVSLNDANIYNKMKERQPKTGEIVDQGLYAQALQDAGGDPQLAAKLYNDRRVAEKKSVAAASVAPPSGEVPLTTLTQAQNLADKFTLKPKAKLDNIQSLVAIANEVKVNPSALPLLKRDLVKLSGDSQISAVELRNILGSSGFTDDVINSVNSFFTGAPTVEKIDDVLRALKAVEVVTANQYEAGRKKAEKVLAEGNVSQATRDAVLPEKYGQPPPKEILPLNDWLTKARISNPGVSNEELTSYYNTKYVKKAK